MANGIQLATAYISLNVRSDEIKKQIGSALAAGVGSRGVEAGRSIGSRISEGIRGHMGTSSLATSILNPLEIAGVRWAVTAGATIGAAFKRALMGAVSLSGIGSVFAVGGVLSAGLARLQTLQASKIQLSLSLDPKSIQDVQAKVTEVVQGTSVALDEAMKAVPRLVNAGMNPEQIKQYVKDVADLSAATGGLADFERLDVILSQVRSKAKLTGEEMQQLVDAGVDVRGMLKKAFGWDDKTLEKNLKRNKVGANELQIAIQKVYGAVDAGNGKTGLAQLLGTKTLDGSIKAAKAAFSRLGANFISALVGKKPDEDPLSDYALGVNKLTEALNGMSKWVDTHREDIANAFTAAKETVMAVVGALQQVGGVLKEYPGLIKTAIGAWVGWKALTLGGGAINKTLDAVGGITRALNLIPGSARKANTALATVTAAGAASSASSTAGALAAGAGAGAVAGRAGKLGKLGRVGGKALRAIPILGTAVIAYDLLTEIDEVREVTDEIPGWFRKAKESITQAFTSDSVKRFVGDAKNAIGDLGSSVKSKLAGVWDSFKTSATSVFDGVWTKIKEIPGKVKAAANQAWESLKSGLKSAVDAVVKYVKDGFNAMFGPDSAVGKLLSALGIGTAKASADAPGSSAPFNPGPRRVPGGGLSGTVGGPLSGTVGGVPAASAGARVPYGLPPGTDTGGYGTGSAEVFPDWVMQIADYFGIKPSTYAGHQQDNRDEPGYAPNPNNLNRGIDWAGPVENLQRFAEYLESIPDSMEQVIWQNPNTGRKTGIGGGQINPGYYDQGTYDVHGGNDPNNIHVHTRQSMSIPLPVPPPTAGGPLGGQLPAGPPPFGDRKNPYATPWATGGGVWGPGSGTSDSIPAWLSNGEHVLTADDVKRMGGQQGVYQFRASLKNGGYKPAGFETGGAVGAVIPRFAPGGAVDPSVVQDAQDNVTDLNNRAAVAQAQLNELMQAGDADPRALEQAAAEWSRANRDALQAQSNLPLVLQGLTPQDFTEQNNLDDLTERLKFSDQHLRDLQASDEEVPYSDLLQAQIGVDTDRRERDQAIAAAQGTKGADYGGDFLRSMGFTPAGASSNAVAGTSSLAGFINMGNSVVSGVIDTGVNLANQAVSAAIAAGAAAGSFGSAAAAAPIAQMAASYGIQLAGNQAKRISSYWFGMAGIGADAAMEIFSPFGASRFVGYDYAGMVPQMGIQEAALGTLEKMGGDAIKTALAGGKNPLNIPADPTAATNTAPSGPSAGSFAAPIPGANQQGSVGSPVPLDTSGAFNTDPLRPDLIPPTGAGGVGGGGSWAGGGHVGIYDNGGVLKPGEFAFNASRTPESILTKQQWNAMAANASTRPRDNAPLVQNLYAQDMQDAIRQLEKTKRREAMQYTGRP